MMQCRRGAHGVGMSERAEVIECRLLRSSGSESTEDAECRHHSARDVGGGKEGALLRFRTRGSRSPLAGPSSARGDDDWPLTSSLPGPYTRPEPSCLSSSRPRCLASPRPRSPRPRRPRPCRASRRRSCGARSRRSRRRSRHVCSARPRTRASTRAPRPRPSSRTSRRCASLRPCLAYFCKVGADGALAGDLQPGRVRRRDQVRVHGYVQDCVPGVR
jgi:hypothetical protein